VPRTFYNPDELRQRVDKVDKLGDEEEQQGLAEVAEDPDHGKCHASEIRVRVAHKDLLQFLVSVLWIFGGAWMDCFGDWLDGVRVVLGDESESGACGFRGVGGLAASRPREQGAELGVKKRTFEGY
jgi:hypothetical protein